MGDGSLTREEMLAELIAAINVNEPPEDAFTVEEIRSKTGWTTDKTYDYLKKARKAGKIENVGRFGRVMYYRRIT